MWRFVTTTSDAPKKCLLLLLNVRRSKINNGIIIHPFIYLFYSSLFQLFILLTSKSMLSSLASPPLCDVAWRSYTLKYKRKMVRDVDMLLDSGSNIRSACIHMKLDRSLYYKWKKACLSIKMWQVEAMIPIM